MASNRFNGGRGADPRQEWSAPSGQPEYFTGPLADPQSAETVPDHPSDRYAADRPGNTRPYPIGFDQDYAEPYGDQDYAAQDYAAQDNVAVYRAGGQVSPHLNGPRLHWRELLTGIYRSPSQTFDRMREHQCWLPALTVSLLYGALAILAMGSHDQIVNSTFAFAAWSIGGAAVAFTIAGAMLGAVTHGLARQFGGDGPWPSTIGLAVLIGWTTDAPRLLFALFLPSGSPLVQGLGWATWLLCAGLLTTMVRRVHDLPWGKAAGAAAVQLLALLVLIKLPTLG